MHCISRTNGASFDSNLILAPIVQVFRSVSFLQPVVAVFTRISNGHRCVGCAAISHNCLLRHGVMWMIDYLLSSTWRLCLGTLDKIRATEEAVMLT